MIPKATLRLRRALQKRHPPSLHEQPQHLVLHVLQPTTPSTPFLDLTSHSSESVASITAASLEATLAQRTSAWSLPRIWKTVSSTVQATPDVLAAAGASSKATKEMSIDAGSSHGWASRMLRGLGGTLRSCNKKLKVDEFCLFSCTSIALLLG